MHTGTNVLMSHVFELCVSSRIKLSKIKDLDGLDTDDLSHQSSVLVLTQIHHSESVLALVCLGPLAVLTMKLPVTLGWKTLSKEHWEKWQLSKEKIADMLPRQCS